MPQELPKVMTVWQFLKRLANYIRPYRFEAALLVVLMSFGPAFTLAFSLSFKFLIDEALPKHDYSLVMTMIVVLSVGWIVSSVAGIWRDYLYGRLGTYVVNDVRMHVFDHLQRLSMSFFSRSQVGDLMSRFTSDLDRLEDVIVGTLGDGIWGFQTVAMSLGILLIVEWKLAVLSVLSLPLCLVGPWLIGNRAAVRTYQVQEKTAALSNTVQENLGAQHVVKAYGLQPNLVAEFARQLNHLSAFASRASFLGHFTQRAPSLGLSLFSVIAISVGALLAYHNYLTPGELVAMQGVLLGLSESVSELATCYPQLIQAAAGMQRIDELLLEQPQIRDAADAVILPRPHREIELRDVSFGYTVGTLNILNVSLTIPVNTMNAFVGPSGSGKSTILNLVTRFYDVTSGAILIDGIDVRQVSQMTLRSHMAVVFQESFLFNTTVRENIRLGRLDASDDEIEAAARAAEIHDVIFAMPQGYDTISGERGCRFSGGQRQRIAIARALLRDPAILILDEATSALDPVTEDQINRTLIKLARGRTVLSVTHRLSSVANYDRIFVLNEGRVVEQGSHGELLNLDGFYSRLWNKQSGFTINEQGDHVAVTADRLASIPILSRLERSLLEELADDFVTDRVPRDRVVVQQGDPADKFYVIVRGEVQVTRTNDDGVRQQLSTLGDGDFFGELALLQNVPRTATVRTLSDAMFLSLSRDRFSKLIDQAPGFRELLVKDYPE